MTSEEIKQRIDAIIKELEENEDSTTAYQQLTDCIEGGEAEEKELALDYLTYLVDNQKALKYTLLLRSWVHYIFGDLERMLEESNLLIEVAPNFPRAYRNRGIAYDELEDFEAVIKEYTKAIELNPKDDKAYYNRGIAYKELEDFEAAIKDYTKAIELNPKDDEAYYNRGITYLRLEDFLAAFKDTTKAIGLNKKNGWSYFNLASLYYSVAIRNSLDEINSIYSAAMQIQGHPYTQSGLTVYRERILSYDMAKYYLREAKHQLLDDAKVHVLFSWIFEATHHHIYARVYLTKAYFLNAKEAAPHVIQFASKHHLDVPLLVARVLRDNPLLPLKKRQVAFVKRTLNDCKDIYTLLRQQAMAKGNTEASLDRFTGLLCFLLGDPITFWEVSHSMDQKAVPFDFQMLYYQLVATTDLMLDDDEYLERFEQLAQEFSGDSAQPQRTDTTHWVRKYYIAQIMAEIGRVEEAIALAEQVAPRFTPAAYLSFGLSFEAKDAAVLPQKAEAIIAREAEAKYFKYHDPIKPLREVIDGNVKRALDDLTFAPGCVLYKWFHHLLYYFEMEEYIHQFQSYARENIKEAIDIQSTRQVLPKAQYFQLTDLQSQEIADNWKQHLLRQIGKEILSTWSRKTVQLSEELSLEALMKRLDDIPIDKQTTVKGLLDVAYKKNLVKHLGKAIEQKSLDEKVIFLILSYCYFDGRISDNDFLMLHIYLIENENKRHGRKESSEADLSNKVFKDWKGSDFFSTGSAITFALQTDTKQGLIGLGAGIGITLIAKITREVSKQYNTTIPYEDFRKDFLANIAAKRETMGKKAFDEKYGPDRFKDWLEPDS